NVVAMQVISHSLVATLSDPLPLTALVVAALGLAGVSGYYLRRSTRRIHADPEVVTVAEGEIAHATVTAQQKIGFGAWRPIPATFLLKESAGGLFEADPRKSGTTQEEPILVVRLTGLRPGAAQLRISGTPLGQEKAQISQLTVTVL